MIFIILLIGAVTGEGELCRQTRDLWRPLVERKSDAHLESRLLQAVVALHFLLPPGGGYEALGCEEARAFIALPAVASAVAMLRAVEDDADTVQALHNALVAANRIDLGRATVIAEAAVGLRRLRDIAAQLTTDMPTHTDGISEETCLAPFRRFMSLVLDVTNEDIPNWDEVRWAVEEACPRSEF